MKKILMVLIIMFSCYLRLIAQDVDCIEEGDHTTTFQRGINRIIYYANAHVFHGNELNHVAGWIDISKPNLQTMIMDEKKDHCGLLLHFLYNGHDIKVVYKNVMKDDHVYPDYDPAAHSNCIKVLNIPDATEYYSPPNNNNNGITIEDLYEVLNRKMPINTTNVQYDPEQACTHYAAYINKFQYGKKVWLLFHSHRALRRAAAFFHKKQVKYLLDQDPQSTGIRIFWGFDTRNRHYFIRMYAFGVDKDGRVILDRNDDNSIKVPQSNTIDYELKDNNTKIIDQSWPPRAQ